MTRSTVCRVDHRRHDVRAMGLNGIDDIEVGDPDPVDGSVTLCVHFLGPVPVDVRPKDLCIDGGGQGAAVAIVSVRANPAVDEDDDDCLEVRLDRSGDASTYCLCLRDLEGFDPRYACRSFTFTGHCDSPLDCLTVPACPPAAVDEPALDFLAKDYATFRRLALDRMSLLVPEWRERHVPDVAVTLVEALAYVGDQLSYYQDAVATEAYLETARRRISVRRHGRLVDYVLGEGANARAFVVLDVDAALDWPAADVVFLTRFPGSPPPGGPPLSAEDVPLPARGAGGTGPGGGDGAGGAGHRWFQPVGGGPSVVRARPEHNVIRFHTWGERECCLVAGATSAALVDESLDLRPGDFLVLEEVRGARTGVPGDADPGRRHVVRLSRVGERVEDVVEKAVVRQVEWCPEDALPFPFCLSAVGGEDCALLTDVTVARGNVVLVDDGATVVETLPAVPDDPMRRMCEGECQPVDEQEAGPPYTVVLDRPDVTFAAQPVGGASAPTCPPSAAALMGGADAPAEPQVVLRADAEGSPWTPRPDLLGAGPDERAFVVEMDEERRAHLRFGDGRMGARPEPGTVFTAEYRVGAGPPGNVGAESLCLVALRGLRQSVAVRARNPLAAAGGVWPEPVADAKLRIPVAFRARRERAITSDDYAELAADAGGSRLQGAAASLAWAGSWYEVDVALDPRGVDGSVSPGGCGGGGGCGCGPAPQTGGAGCACAGDDVAEVVAAALARARRMGHEVRVAQARAVPLDVELTVCVRADQVTAHVQAALVDAFSARAWPNGGVGFFHPDQWTMGQSVYASALLAAAHAVPGVESAEVTRLQRQGDVDRGERAAGVLRVSATEVVVVSPDGVHPRRGRFEVVARGGR